MKSFLYLVLLTPLVPVSIMSHGGSYYRSRPFLTFDLISKEILQGLDELEKSIKTVNQNQKTLFEMAEKDDSIELIFKCPEFQMIESDGKEVITLSKKYSCLNALKALCLKTKFFNATIKCKQLKRNTSVYVDITQEEHDKNNGLDISYFQKQSMINAVLDMDRVSAEFDKAQGVLKVMIPKNPLNIQVAEIVVPVTVVQPQGTEPK